MVLLFVFSGASVTLRGAEVSFCKSGEVMVASCNLNEKRNRMISFCADVTKQVISYRFGLSSGVEIDSVFVSEKPLSRWVDAATYTVYLGFRRGGYSYVFGVPQETLGAKAFLKVARDNKNIMNSECTDNSFGEKGFGSEAIQEVSDELVREHCFTFPPD